LKVSELKGWESKRGTLSFMAPELWSPHSIKNEKCDVFSIGVTLYLMLFGDLPFTDASPFDPNYKLLCSQKDAFWKGKRVISNDLRHLLELMMSH